MEAIVVGSSSASEPLCRSLCGGGVTASAVENLEALDGAAPDLVFLAIGPGSESAGAAIGSTRRLLQAARIVLVAPDGSLDLRRALVLGVEAVVWESDLATTAVPTALAVAAGQLVFPASLRESGRQRALSTREKQVLALLVLGYSNAEIAEKLFLTESTVKGHLATAYKKLGVRSRNAAVALILETLGTGILAITDGDRIEVGVPDGTEPLRP